MLSISLNVLDAAKIYETFPPTAKTYQKIIELKQIKILKFHKLLLKRDISGYIHDFYTFNLFKKTNMTYISIVELYIVKIK